MSPIGNRCEFEDFDDCVRVIMSSGSDLEAAQAICGAISRDTKERCEAMEKIQSLLEVDEELIDVTNLDKVWVAKIAIPDGLDLNKTQIIERRYV